MRLSLKTKQVAGVTLIVAMAMVVVNALYLARIARISLEESQSRGELLARSVSQAATETARPDALEASLKESRTVRVLAEAGMAYSENVTYVAITDTEGRAIVHSSPIAGGRRSLAPAEQLSAVIAAGTLAHLRAIYSDRTFEVRDTLLFDGRRRRGEADSGTIRVGLSMLLVRENLREAMEPTLLDAARRGAARAGGGDLLRAVAAAADPRAAERPHPPRARRVRRQARPAEAATSSRTSASRSTR